jgi:protein required for attachment to host cells
MTRRTSVAIVKPPVTWILVADSRQAQVYVRHRTEKSIPLAGNSRRNQFEEIIAHAPVPVTGMKWVAESTDQYKVSRDRLGRVQESANSAHHMSEPRIDVKEEIREHFARTIAQELYRAREAKAFDRLVLIAAPKMLGEIKKHLDKKIAKLIMAEMPKDLAHYDSEEVTEYLNNIA